MKGPELSRQVDEVIGYTEASGGSVWYRKVNASKPGIPLLTLHGGPGYATDLEPLSGLDRPVVFYHQLGCGNSKLPDQDTVDHSELWQLPRFVDELATVCKHLKLDRVHLLGYSFGGMVVLDALLREYQQNRLPQGVASVVFASSPFSVQVVIDDMKRLITPRDFEKIRRYEAFNRTDHPNYQKYLHDFHQRHVFGEGFNPDEHESLIFSEQTKGKEVELAMIGKSPINPTGSLKDYERRHLLPMLRGIPILLTCGRFDEITPESVTEYQKMIGAELKIFEKSAHFAQWTEREAYIATLNDFLHRVESVNVYSLIT